MHAGLAGIAAQKAGAGEAALLVDNGDLLGTDGFGRFVLSRSPESAAALGTLIADTGYDAVTLGMRELAAPPDRLDPYLTALAKGGVAIVSANVSCTKERAATCEHVVPNAVVEVAGLRVGIVGVVAADVTSRLAPERARDWTVTDPREALTAQIADLQEKSDLIVVLAHVEAPGTAPQRTRAVAASVAGWDVMVGNASFDSTSASHIQQMRLSSRDGLILGTARYAEHVTVVPIQRAEDEVELGTPRVEAIDASAGREGERADRLREWARDYCGQMSVPIAGAEFEGTWTEDALRRYTLGVMREVTRAELAIVNRDHLRVGDNVLSGPVTRDLLYRAFPFDDTIGTIQLAGADLESLLKGSSDLFQEPGPDRLAVVGAKKSDGGITVNGRKLDPAAVYAVAVTSFIASGGDGYLAPRSDFREYVSDEDKEAPFLRDVIADWVAEGRGDRIALSDIQDLSAKPLWILSADAQLAFNNVDVTNQAAYADTGQPQLTRSPATGQNYRAAGRAILDTRNIGWQTGVDLKYAQTVSQVVDDTTGETRTVTTENTDEARLNSVLQYQGWRKKPRSPVPYVEVDIESEFTTGNPFEDTGADEFHHFLTTGTAGVRSEILPKLELFAGAGVRSELFRPVLVGRFGVQVGYRLQPITLAHSDHFEVKLDSQLEYFRASPIKNASDRILWSNKLNFLVFRYLTAGVALDAFAYREDDPGTFATSTQLMFTLGATWNARAQTF